MEQLEDPYCCNEDFYEMMMVKWSGRKDEDFSLAKTREDSSLQNAQPDTPTTNSPHETRRTRNAIPNLGFHDTPPHHTSIINCPISDISTKALVSTTASTTLDFILRPRIQLLLRGYPSQEPTRRTSLRSLSTGITMASYAWRWAIIRHS